MNDLKLGMDHASLTTPERAQVTHADVSGARPFAFVHSITICDGWREVVETTTQFVRRFA